jgi:hypothetical protein
MRADRTASEGYWCFEGGTHHQVPIVPREDDRPAETFCLKCGKRFVRDRSRRQGYRAEDPGQLDMEEVV